MKCCVTLPVCRCTADCLYLILDGYMFLDIQPEMFYTVKCEMKDPKVLQVDYKYSKQKSTKSVYFEFSMVLQNQFKRNR